MKTVVVYDSIYGNTKAIALDSRYVDAHTNGLVYTRSRLEGQPFMAHVNLFKGERSEMAEVAANLM